MTAWRHHAASGLSAWCTGAASSRTSRSCAGWFRVWVADGVTIHHRSSSTRKLKARTAISCTASSNDTLSAPAGRNGRVKTGFVVPYGTEREFAELARLGEE